MTIAIRLELKEDWGSNMPEVRVMAKTLRHLPRQVARLTPQWPSADVCITKDADLYFEVTEPHAVSRLETGK